MTFTREADFRPSTGQLRLPHIVYQGRGRTMASQSRGNVVQFPPVDWCVRAGYQAAHYFIRRGGKSVALCGMISRSDCYFPQWSRPRQAEKSHCRACERVLEQAERKTAP